MNSFSGDVAAERALQRVDENLRARGVRPNSYIREDLRTAQQAEADQDDDQGDGQDDDLIGYPGEPEPEDDEVVGGLDPLEIGAGYKDTSPAAMIRAFKIYERRMGRGAM